MEDMMKDVVFQTGTIQQVENCRSFDQHISVEFLKWKLQHDEIFLAMHQNEVVGYLRLEYIWTTLPYIGLIFLKDEFRGQDIGKNLLQFLEEYLKQKGKDKLYSSSQIDEPPPQQWHRKMGFTECGVLNSINDNGVGELFFVKILL